MWIVRTRSTYQKFFYFGAAQQFAKKLASEGTEVRLEHKDGHLMLLNASWPTFFVPYLDWFNLNGHKMIISEASTEDVIVLEQKYPLFYGPGKVESYSKEEFLKLFKGK